MPRVSWCAVVLLAAGCGPRRVPAEPELRWVDDDERRASVPVPASWSDEVAETTRIFAGPEGDPSFYTTITLRRLRAPGSLEAAVAALFEPARSLRRYHLEPIEPASVAGRPALVYRVEFELHESLRRKVGAVIDDGDTLVDLSYGSIDALYGVGLDAYDLALHGLALY